MYLDGLAGITPQQRDAYLSQLYSLQVQLQQAQIQYGGNVEDMQGGIRVQSLQQQIYDVQNALMQPVDYPAPAPAPTYAAPAPAPAPTYAPAPAPIAPQAISTSSQSTQGTIAPQALSPFSPTEIDVQSVAGELKAGGVHETSSAAAPSSSGGGMLALIVAAVAALAGSN